MAGRRGDAWNDEDIARLRRMARAKAKLIDIARELERTPWAVAARAQRLKIKVVE